MAKICLDIDGTVTQYPFKFLAKKYFGVDLSPMGIYAYDLADVLGVSNKAIDLMFHDTVFGKPMFNDGALTTLQNWYNKHELIVFTNRTRYMTILELTKWLTDNNIPFHGIDIKGDGAYDFHVDDRPTKLMETNSKVKLLLDAPWNRRCHNVTGQLKRVYNWQEIKEMVGVYEYV
jgi:uncharacterized HAD superfamily protein